MFDGGVNGVDADDVDVPSAAATTKETQQIRSKRMTLTLCNIVFSWFRIDCLV